jgi:chemotaxis protein MotB
MALSARRARRPAIDIWPGFVDALAQLLMVIIFILLVFTAGQFYLTGALTDRDTALQRLAQQLNELTDLLSIEKQSSGDLRLSVAQLSTQLQNANRDRDALTTRIAEFAARAEDATARADRAESQLAEYNRSVSVDKEKVELQVRELESLRRDVEALRSVRAQLEGQVQNLAAANQQGQQDLTAARDRTKELETRLSTAEERTALAQKDIQQKDVRLAEKEAQVAVLNQNILALREQLQRLTAALQLAETENKDSQTQIADLGRRLNVALANKVEELARYRSEFFGRLRQILGDRPDIRVVGDRFVFQSEVLFTQGSAEFGDEAKTQLLPLVGALKDLSARIPKDINWVLRVDGHTDLRPINTPQFPSNWELSTARAISVVKFMVEQGIPAERLAAAGFAEFQPLDNRPDEAAFRRNRRIELKLTDR